MTRFVSAVLRTSGGHNAHLVLLADVADRAAWFFGSDHSRNAGVDHPYLDLIEPPRVVYQ